MFFIDGTTNFYGPVVVGTPCNMLSSADTGASKSTCPSGVLGEGRSYTPDAANERRRWRLLGRCAQYPLWISHYPELLAGPILRIPCGPASRQPQPETEAEADGCLYEGMTYFDFLSNGDVYVYSPGTAAAVAAGTFTLNSGLQRQR